MLTYSLFKKLINLLTNMNQWKESNINNTEYLITIITMNN